MGEAILVRRQGGKQLPELINPGTEYDLISGKELIDQEGNIITGNIPIKYENNLETNGATIMVPAGYYASDVSKSVTTSIQATPSISIDSVGKITASVTQTEGYISAGTKNATKQLTIKKATTITPTTSEQTAVFSGIYTTGDIKIGPIPSKYKDTSTGNVTADQILKDKIAFNSNGKITGTMPNYGAVSQALNCSGSYTIPAGYHNGSGKVTANSLASQTNGNASSSDVLSGKTAWVNGSKITGVIPLLGAQNITPTTYNQIIKTGCYLSGNQTIIGDANLTPSNIVSGKSIFGVEGTAKIIPQSIEIYNRGTFYTGYNYAVGSSANEGHSNLSNNSHLGVGVRFGYLYITPAIDMTPYRTLTIIASGLDRVGVSTNGQENGLIVQQGCGKPSGETTYIIDVSGINQSAYITITRYHTTNAGNMYLYYAKLEY